MNKKKLKAIHIHTDYKFVSSSDMFEGELFENEIIIFQNKEPFKGNIHYKSILLKTTIKDIEKAIEICKNADLVVMYDLNTIKCHIALALPDKIKIAWRFLVMNYMEGKRNCFLVKTL